MFLIRPGHIISFRPNMLGLTVFVLCGALLNLCQGCNKNISGNREYINHGLVTNIIRHQTKGGSAIKYINQPILTWKPSLVTHRPYMYPS